MTIKFGRRFRFDDQKYAESAIFTYFEQAFGLYAD
jgi:hypothetical protein